MRTRLRRRRPIRPSLRFTPTAWAKFLFLRDRRETEVGGFGVSNPEDLLLIEDVILVQQICSVVTVAFDDAAVADYFDAQIDRGLRPEQFARIWLHTHPGHSATPSLTDEETFARVFGGCDWAVMGILAQGGATYARLRFNTGPGGSLLIPVEVDYRRPFIGSDADAWAAEYDACVAAIPARSFDLGRSEEANALGRWILPDDALTAERLEHHELLFDSPTEQTPLPLEP